MKFLENISLPKVLFVMTIVVATICDTFTDKPNSEIYMYVIALMVTILTGYIIYRDEKD